MDTGTRIAELEDVLGRIPLARAMQVRVEDYSAGRLRLAAPARPNRNHFDIAFGGAIECLGTLAGWGLLWLELGDPGLRIVIQHAEIDFRAPLSGDLNAIVNRPEKNAWERFRNVIEKRSRGRIELTARIGDAGHVEGARFKGRYAIAPAG